MAMVYGDDPRKIAEALTQFRDEGRSGGYASLREMDRAYVEGLVRKWAPYLGERVKIDEKVYEMHPIPPAMWPMMAMVLENQVQFNPPQKTVWEATTKSEVSLPSEFTLPIIREIFPSLIMNNICSIQPMPAQSGGVMNVHWLKFYRENVDPEEQVTTANSGYAARNELQVPKKMRLKITRANVTATKDILNAEWSTELQEDMRGTLGLDPESELLQAMAQEIMRELEERVLKHIETGAGAGNVNWDDTIGSGYTAKEWYETLFHAVIDAEKLVRDTRHRNCDYIIAGSQLVTFLMKATNFSLTPDVGPTMVGPLPSGVRFEGRLANRWDLYSTPYISQEKAIVSYYPESMLHTGYIWSPYVPLMPMPLTYGTMNDYDDDTNQPGALVNKDGWNRNIRTRNGRYFCEPNMFATITVT
jgi:hypothetical protein